MGQKNILLSACICCNSASLGIGMLLLAVQIGQKNILLSACICCNSASLGRGASLFVQIGQKNILLSACICCNSESLGIVCSPWFARSEFFESRRFRYQNHILDD